MGPVVKLKRVASSLTAAAATIAVLTIVARILGFGRWLTQAATVQASATGSAYATANTLPNILFEVIAGGALASVVVPVLAGPISKKIRGDVHQISSALLTWTLLLLTPVAVLVGVFAYDIAELLPVPHGAVASVHYELTGYFLTIFSPQIVLYGMGVVLTGVLQAHRRFLAPAVVPIASSVVVIISYLIFGALAQGMQETPQLLPQASLIVLAWGTTLGVVALSLPLLIPVLRTDVRLRPALRFPPGVGKRVARLAAAGIGNLLAQQLAVFAVMVSAHSGGTTGTYNVFQYTNAVFMLPYAVLVVPLATAVFPRISELANSSKRTLLRTTAESSTRAVLALAAVGSALLIVVAPAVENVFATWSNVDGMGNGLSAMAFGVIGFSLVFHAGRILFALDLSRHASFVIAGGWVLVATIAYCVVKFIIGDVAASESTLLALGAAHAIGLGLAGIGLLWLLHRELRFTHRLRRSIIISLLGATLGCLAARPIVDSISEWSQGNVLWALVAMLIGAIVLAMIFCATVWRLDRGIINSVRRMRA